MQYIAFVNAVLGGFAFAFLGAMLTIENPSRVLKATFIVTAIAAGCFLIATLGSTLLAGVMESVKDGRIEESFLEPLRPLNRPISLTFLAGVLFLTVSIGLFGWIRSRNLGIATSLIAVFIGIGAFFMIAPFIR